MSLTLGLEPGRAEGTAIERRFLGWDVPFLPSVAALLAERYAAGSELRMDGVAVIVPGARAGRRLKELLLAESERRSLRLVPPRIATVGTLPELLHKPVLPVASGVLARRAWVMALRGLGPARLAMLIKDPPGAGDVRGWTRMAGMIEGLHEEVSGAGLTFADVATRCGDGLLFDDGDRWRVLAEAQARYGAVLDSLGMADSGLSRIAALNGGVEDPGAEVWLAGVVEMPRVLKSMLRQLQIGPPVRSLVHAPATEGHRFDELGCVVAAAWSSCEVPLSEDQLAVRGRPADQAEETAVALARLEGAYAADEITVAVPDEEVTVYLEQRLGSAGVPVRRATGARLDRTAALRLLSGIADYLDGHRYDACAALARHPDLWPWIRGADGSGGGAGTAALRSAGGWIHALDEHFTSRLPSRLRPGAVDGVDSMAAVVGALCRSLDDRLLGRLGGRQLIGAWMGDILAILREVYGDRPLSRTNPEQRELLESLIAVKDGAVALHRLPHEADEEVDAATAIRLLIDEIGGQTIAPRADDAAVELLGWLEVHLDDAPVTVVTGFNEGSVPQSVNAHPYLPDALRTRIGLVDNEARYGRDAYQLTALVHSKRELRLIAGRQTVRGDPLRPSRLMFAVRGRTLAERIQRFYGPEAGRPEGAPPRGTAGGSDSAFMLPPEPRLIAPLPIAHLSVSQFGAVLEDPYLFALRAVLGLDVSDDAATELDGLAFGSLAHLVLQRFGASAAARSQDPAEVRAELDRLLTRAVDERHGDDAIPAVRLQIEQLRARLHAFARWQASWAAEGWEIVGTECRVPPEGVELTVDDEPFRVNGRIDRIDHNRSLNAWAVFDYKTADAGDPPDKTHRKGRGAARVWVDLQLPLYRHILPHVLDAAGDHPFRPQGSDDIRLGYILLPKDQEKVGASFAAWTAAELEEAEEAAHDVVRLVRRGEFLWDPALPRRVRDPRIAALLGLGYLEAAAAADEGETADV